MAKMTANRRLRLATIDVTAQVSLQTPDLVCRKLQSKRVLFSLKVKILMSFARSGNYGSRQCGVDLQCGTAGTRGWPLAGIERVGGTAGGALQSIADSD
jgi:hypothetical protein